MVELSSESLISLKDACAYLPGRPHISTMWRWIKRGIAGIRLETVKVGGKRFTSVEAIERFIASTTAEADIALSGDNSAPRVASNREKQVDQARRICNSHGV